MEELSVPRIAPPGECQVVVVVWDSDDPAARDDPRLCWTVEEALAYRQQQQPGQGEDLTGQPKGMTLAELRWSCVDEPDVVVVDSETRHPFCVRFPLAPYRDADPQRTRFLFEFSHGDDPPYAGNPYTPELVAARQAVIDARDARDEQALAAARRDYCAVLEQNPSRDPWQGPAWDPARTVQLQRCRELIPGVLEPALWINDKRRRPASHPYPLTAAAPPVATVPPPGLGQLIVIVWNSSDPGKRADERFWWSSEEAAAIDEHWPGHADLTGSPVGWSLRELRRHANQSGLVNIVVPDEAPNRWLSATLSLTPYWDADPLRTRFALIYSDGLRTVSPGAGVESELAALFPATPDPDEHTTRRRLVEARHAYHAAVAAHDHGSATAWTKLLLAVELHVQEDGDTERPSLEFVAVGAGGIIDRRKRRGGWLRRRRSGRDFLVPDWSRERIVKVHGGSVQRRGCPLAFIVQPELYLDDQRPEVVGAVRVAA